MYDLHLFFIISKRALDHVSIQIMNTLPLFHCPLEYLTYHQHDIATYKFNP